MTNSKSRNQQNLQIVITATPQAASLHVAEMFASLIKHRPRSVLGLATGGTPVGVYQELVRRHQAEGLCFSELTTFNLDEYIGLAGDHTQSFRKFMQDQLFDHVNIDPAKTHVPSGIAEDTESHIEAYENSIQKAGGIDLQLLGIGTNGHIAFNEPGSPRDSRTRVVNLTSETIQSNSRFFDDASQVPTTAITMGIATIMEAKQIVLMATGKNKARAVREALQEPPTESNPASLLQEHTDVTFVLDIASAAKLKLGKDS